MERRHEDDEARIALAREMFDVALTAVSAERCLPSYLPPPPEG